MSETDREKPAELDESPATSGRRAVLGKAAIAAAVAAVAGTSMSKTAYAGNGNAATFQQGAANINATITTSLSGGSTLQVTDGSSAGIAGGLNPRVGSIYGRQTVANRVGVLGEATSSAGGWGVYGRSSSSQGRGVYGLTIGTSGAGVYGEHRAGSTDSGTGVVGLARRGTGVLATAETGVGLRAVGTTFDLEANGSGRVLVNKAGVTTPPTGASTVGTLARDAASNLWYCTASGTPGTWINLARALAPLVFFPLTPYRAYDSREALPAQGPLAMGNTRTIVIKDQRAVTGGAVTTADRVPAGATAITANITVVNTVSGGFLTANPGGNLVVTAATINWSETGQILNNGVTLAIGAAARDLSIIAGGSAGAQTDFVIDVTGYFAPQAI
jgi:hypothetical protein